MPRRTQKERQEQGLEPSYPTAADHYRTLRDLCKEAGLHLRQTTVILYAARGYTDRQIALRLKCSQKCVGNVLDAGVRKLAETFPVRAATTPSEARAILACYRGDRRLPERPQLDPELDGGCSEWVEMDAGSDYVRDRLAGARPHGTVPGELAEIPAERLPGKYLLSLTEQLLQVAPSGRTLQRA